MLAGHHAKALAHLTRCPVTDSGESIELCIQTVSLVDEYLYLRLTVYENNIIRFNVASSGSRLQSHHVHLTTSQELVVGKMKVYT